MPPRGRRTELDKQYDFRQGSELTRELGEEAAKRLDAAYKINKKDKLKNDLRSGLSCWHMQVMDNKIMDERAVADKALEDQTKAKNVTILACAYERGKGRSRNTKKARKLYQKAAMMGDTDAAKFLAGCCLRGVGGKADPAEAFRWYKVAYDAGDLGAQGALADLYDAGLGCERNAEEAQHLLKGCRNGIALAPGAKAFPARLDSSRGGMTAKERQLARYNW
jgi:hypothetical protein